MNDLRYQVDLLTAKNQKLEKNLEMDKHIIDSTGSAFLYVDLDANTVEAAGSIGAFFDFSIDDPNELYKLTDAFFDEDAEELRRLLYIENEKKETESLDLRLKDEVTWVKVTCNVEYDSFGAAKSKVISFANVTKNKIQKDELTFFAYYDYLTNLFNRNYFISKLKEFVEKAKESNTIVSVLLLDIDDFHKLSDSKGIVLGDEIIQNLGLFIRSLTDSNVIAARFDSDIFGIAIFDPCGQRSVDAIYRSIKEYLSTPIKLTDMTEVSVSVSVGVSEFPESADDYLTLIKNAEVVMLKAKDEGKNTIKFFDSSILSKFLKDVEIETKLKEAVASKSIFLNYQPQFFADTKKLRGVEALVRMRDRDGALISPAVFIPLSEKNGTIIPISDFVLDEAVKTYSEWRKRFDYDFILSVNISSVQFYRADFVPKIISAIEKYGIDPHRLEIEITESILIEDIRLVKAKIEELRDYGVRVSLDDFGTGYSSLSYLRGLPIDVLKIDKSFIDNIPNESSSRIIAEAIMVMSKKLGYETIAEGVESKEQLDYLKEIGSDSIQGFYLSKPVSKKEIDELLLRMI